MAETDQRMRQDQAEEERVERNSDIAALVLFFSVLVPVIGLLAGWDFALYMLEVIGVLGGVAIVAGVLAPRLIEHLPLPAWMTPRRLIGVAVLVAWAVWTGLSSGWLLALQLGALLVLMQFVWWFYENKATGRPKQVMGVAGTVIGTVAMVAFLAALAGWW